MRFSTVVTPTSPGGEASVRWQIRRPFDTGATDFVAVLMGSDEERA
ncbi:hypothetical protein OG271_13875 [Micromonospora rifamycinica]|nr:hypothetical protein [Micromonospora rifamycinica]